MDHFAFVMILFKLKSNSSHLGFISLLSGFKNTWTATDSHTDPFSARNASQSCETADIVSASFRVMVTHKPMQFQHICC